MRGIYVTLILYPITLILAFLASLKHRLVLIPGIIGVICWASSLVAITHFNAVYREVQPHVEYGAGIFVGLVGAIIFCVGYFLKPRRTMLESPESSNPKA